MEAFLIIAMETIKLASLIKKINRRKLIMPILFLIFTVFIFFRSPLHHILSIKMIDSPSAAAGAYHKGDIYVRADLENLYYTGVNQMNGRTVKACYYYCIDDGNCYYILISAKSLGITPENSTPPACLESYKCMARLEQTPLEIGTLTSYVSKGLNWTSQALNLMSSQILISQYAMSLGKEYLLLALIVLALFTAIIHIILIVISLINPELSRTVLRLGRYGAGSGLYQKACGEYETSHPYAPGITLTETFFIGYDRHNIHIVPLSDIVWAYKFGTMHTRLFRSRISYSISVVTSNKKHYILHHKTKEAVEQVLTALQTRFPEILIGYNEGRRERSSKKSI